MARLDDALDLAGGFGHLVHAAHRKINLLHIFGPGKVAGHRIGNQNRLILDLRHAHVVHALPENADHRKGNAADLKALANGRIRAAKPVMRKLLADHGALEVGYIVGIVQKAALGRDQVANVHVLRAYAQHQRILHHAPAIADGGVHFHHRRGVHHAGQLRQHGFLVIARQVVVEDSPLLAHCPAAAVFQLHRVGLQLLQFLKDELLAGQTDGHHQDHRSGADDHAQRGQREAHLAGAEAVHGQLENLAEHHGAAGAQERLFKSVMADLFSRIHRFLYSLQWTVDSEQWPAD